MRGRRRQGEDVRQSHARSARVAPAFSCLSRIRLVVSAGVVVCMAVHNEIRQAAADTCKVTIRSCLQSVVVGAVPVSMASSNLSGFPNASRPAPRKLIPRSETKRYYSSVSHATRHHRCLSYLGATQQVEATQHCSAIARSLRSSPVDHGRKSVFSPNWPC